MAYQNQSGDRLKEITDKLEKGLQDLFSSGQYADYLKTMSKFYNYSASNTLLIYMQRPDASRVAGYGDWQKNFKRHVKRGEHGIKILAPCPYKQKVEREQTGPDGRAVTVTEEVTRAAFKPVTVFDVSQTEGEPLPSLGVNELTGDVEHYPDFFEALKQVSPFPVGFEAIPGGAKGYCNYAEQRIAINEGMAEVQNVKTAIHEITHATLHNYYAEKEKEVPPEQRKDQRTREVEAESVAYTVCQHYGIETSDYSFGYIAGWSSDKQTKELKASLATIRETAAGLIDSIDGAYQEIVKGKEQVQVQAAPVQEAPGQGEPDADPDTFNIYQLKGGDALHYHHFTGLDQLKKEGLKVEFENYEKVYSGPWTRGDKLEGIYERFNIDRPEDFTGHSLSVSDVVVLHRGGKDTSYYVDSTGFTELAQFIRPPFDVERAAAYVQKISGNVQDADERKTMGAAAFRANVKRLKKLYGEIPPDRPQLRLLVNCAAASPDLAALKERTAVLTEAVNHLKTAELSMEQNYNMIDGIINNLPPDATMNDRANALIDFVEKDGQRLGDGERRLIVYYAEQVQDTGKLAALVDELAGTGYEQEHGQLNYLVKSRVEAEAAAADAQHQKDGPLPPEHDPAVQPVVTVIWSENAALHNGQKMPLAEADALFKQLDAVPREPGQYEKTSFRIDFTFNGALDSYEGRQDFGDGDGGLIDHIQSYREFYAKDEQWKDYVLRNDGPEALEKDTAQRETALTEFVPYLRLHCNLTQMERAADDVLAVVAKIEEPDGLDRTNAAYYGAVQAYVTECRGQLNTGAYQLPEAPKNSHALYKTDGTIFTRTRLPGEEKRLAVALLIDESGSMGWGDRMTHARKTAIVLYDFCKSLGIPITIYGHSTDAGGVALYSYAEFDSVDNEDCYRLMDMCDRNGNRDGAALRFVAEHLCTRPELQKLLILISDGQPADYGYSGTEAEADLRGIKKEYEKRDVILFAAAIGDDKENIRRIYKDGFLDITKLEELPKNMAQLVKQHLK